MASSTHTQQSRYSLSISQNSRDEAVRLPSIKDLNFHYSRRHTSQDIPPHNQNPTVTHTEPPINSQENSVRWARTNLQPQTPSPTTATTTTPSGHIQHHQQHQQHPHQQQHTPPLSAGHEPLPKNDYSSKQDGAFLTPGMPLSAQSTPVPGSVTIGPGTRGDDTPHSKRRRSSGNMNINRDAPSPHQPPYPHYASYPSAQQPQPAYSQMQPPTSHQGHPVQPPLEHPHAQVPVPHPSYTNYSHQQYMPTRVHPHAPPPQHQHQPTSTNPYPSPAPLPPAQAPWEQTHHAQPHAQPPQHPHQPPPTQLQHQTHNQPAHPPVPQHAQHAQHVQHHHHPAHVITHHQPPPPPPPQHHIQHQQHHQPQQNLPPPPQAHHPQQHAQVQPQQQQAPPQMQHPQMPYARTTSIVPIDTRSQYPVAGQDRAPSVLSQIVSHCSALYKFASRYVEIQYNAPDVYPTPEELAEMSHRAVEVVRLVEEYRRLHFPESERGKIDTTAVITPPDDHRPPKRPWEDMSQEENAGATESAASFAEQQYPTPVDKAQSTAEQDMEIIRTKRATSTAGGSTSAGQPKSKYRKRSRATPPGKCHSCNIRETPEWRRGPDGARTLCNACGLHYAKLQRKHNKQAGPNGEPPRIDMETLRASARAADIGEKTHTRSKNNSRSQQQSTESTSPMETGKPLPQQHHQSSFQVVSMMPPDSSISSATHSDAGRVSSQQQQTQQQQPHQAMQQLASMAAAAPPPWSTSAQPSAPAGRGYAPDQLQHQSFMRTTHQTTNHNTSPR